MGVILPLVVVDTSVVVGSSVVVVSFVLVCSSVVIESLVLVVGGADDGFPSVVVTPKEKRGIIF